MIIGIDLGTSTSEVSVLRNGKPHLIREVRGSSRGILPSVVGVNSRGAIVVGEDIVSQLIIKPELAVQEVKRKMGSSDKLPLGAEEYTPQELSAFILRHLKDEAERYLGEPVTEAVITVPAYFTDTQRRATQDAGELAGLTVRRLINEPTAAALAYGIERPGVEEFVAVYDLGGGTLDVTILELSESVLDVLASTGNGELGGKDFDERLMSFVAAECRRSTGVDLLAVPRSRQRLKAECKRAKEALSASETAMIVLDNVSMSPDGSPLDFEVEITRHRFESLIGELVESTREQLDEALAAKELEPRQIQTVLLVGGSTRVPMVRQFVSNYFGGRVFPTHINPEEAVSLGAAVLAGILDGEIDTSTLVITDVSAFTLGIAVSREVAEEKEFGFFDPLIEKQSTIPRTARKNYKTSYDWQDSVNVQVFQGDAPMCVDNTLVGAFSHPMEPAPAGAELDIEFSYDLSGKVTVVARDLRTGKKTVHELVLATLRMSDEEKLGAKQRFDRRWRANQSGAHTSGTSAASSNAQAGAGPRTGASSSARSAEQGMDDRWKSSPLYEKVAALMTFAEKQSLSLPPTTRTQVEHLLSQMRAALQVNDQAKLNTLEETLTDFLFELE